MFNNGKSGHIQIQNDGGDITEHFDVLLSNITFIIFAVWDV